MEAIEILLALVGIARSIYVLTNNEDAKIILQQ